MKKVFEEPNAIVIFVNSTDIICDSSCANPIINPGSNTFEEGQPVGG